MKSFYIGVCFLGILFACTKEAQVSTLSGTWKLIAYQQVETAALETEPSGLAESVEIHFSDNGLTGILSGHTVTNQYPENMPYRAAIRSRWKDLAEQRWLNQNGATDSGRLCIRQALIRLILLG